jgi:LuxR family maltose regulon positive regulatory protein
VAAPARSHAQGDRAEAVACLERAVALGEPEGYARAFTQHGAALLPVLRLLPASKRATAYVRALTAACAAGEATRDRLPDTQDQNLVDPLSHRELEVLRLLATDLSGPDLARHLVVSLNTLRSHTKSIYAKLGVSGRRAAVSRARELNLLSRREA